jgi:hypothetical protein
MTQKQLKNYIEKVINETLKEQKKLRVFDLDDTLVKTTSKVRVEKENGETLVMTPAEYAIYEKQPGDVFDYGDFQRLVDPKQIEWTTRILRRVVTKHGTDAAVILTARSTETPAKEFFEMYDIPEIPIVALGDSHPVKKAQWILYVAKKFNFTEIEFFDDSYKNIAAVDKIKNSVPGVKIITRLIE